MCIVIVLFHSELTIIGNRLLKDFSPDDLCPLNIQHIELLAPNQLSSGADMETVSQHEVVLICFNKL
jgi:hypothetical protein